MEERQQITFEENMPDYHKDAVDAMKYAIDGLHRLSKAGGVTYDEAIDNIKQKK